MLGMDEGRKRVLPVSGMAIGGVAEMVAPALTISTAGGWPPDAAEPLPDHTCKGPKPPLLASMADAIRSNAEIRLGSPDCLLRMAKVSRPAE
jgi:hypothetical protein